MVLPSSTEDAVLSILCLTNKVTYILIYSCYHHTKNTTPVKNTLTVSLKSGRTPNNECPRYDIKQPDGETSVILKLWGMQIAPLLPSLPGPL